MDSSSQIPFGPKTLNRKLLSVSKNSKVCRIIQEQCSLLGLFEVIGIGVGISTQSREPHTSPVPAASRKDKQAETGLISSHNTKTRGSSAHGCPPGPWVARGSNLSQSLARQVFAHLHPPCHCGKKTCGDLTYTDQKMRYEQITQCYLKLSRPRSQASFPCLFPKKHSYHQHKSITSLKPV